MSESAPPAARDGEWMDLPGAMLQLDGTLRLRERRHADATDLLEQLRHGDYAKPFVVDDGIVRRLHFSLEYVQSEMRIAQPHELRLAYTRKMMAFLLFVPRPHRIVIVGLGGGSMTKFCHRELSRARVTTLEIDADVIGFSKLFQVPADDARVQILHTDAVNYFATTRETADVVLFDGCDRHGVASVFCNEDYYRSIRDRLRPGGLLVANLVGSERDVQEHLRHIASVFSGRLMVQRVGGDGNQLAFVFKNPAFRPNWNDVMVQAKRLQKQHGLDFPTFAKRLRHSKQFQAMSHGG